MAEERIQRRLAAILAADLVGYSRLMEDDEAGTLNRLKELRRELFVPGPRNNSGLPEEDKQRRFLPRPDVIWGWSGQWSLGAAHS
jgi:hypothetical protein